MCEICSKLTIKTSVILQCCLLLTHFTRYSGVFIIDLQQVSAGWDMGILKHVKANIV